MCIFCDARSEISVGSIRLVRIAVYITSPMTFPETLGLYRENFMLRIRTVIHHLHLAK